MARFCNPQPGQIITVRYLITTREVAPDRDRMTVQRADVLCLSVSALQKNDGVVWRR